MEEDKGGYASWKHSGFVNAVEGARCRSSSRAVRMLLARSSARNMREEDRDREETEV